MVKYSPGRLNATFAALADPIRRAILARLAHGELSVSELATPFDVSLPAVSKHLRVLERAGLLAGVRDGRVYRCRLAAGPLRDAAEWIDRYRGFWERRFRVTSRSGPGGRSHRRGGFVDGRVRRGRRRKAWRR